MSYLSFSSIGQSDDDALPAVSPHSLFEERKIINRASGGGTVIEDREPSDTPVPAAPAEPVTTTTTTAMPPVHFPIMPKHSAAERIFGVEYPVAFLLVVSNVITLLICMLLILIAG
jgi:hypothetical protein